VGPPEQDRGTYIGKKYIPFQATININLAFQTERHDCIFLVLGTP